jgi:hypothetical protein
MVIYLVILAVIPVLGALYLKIGKVRSMDRLRSRMEQEIVRRLESIASETGGTLVEGPALKTQDGVLWLLASRAPQSMAIDVAKFVAPVPTSQTLTVVPTRDAGKVMSRGLKAVTPDDPSVASLYQVFASDETWARSVVNSTMAEKLRDVDRFAGTRFRLQIAGGKATILVQRGLVKPDELKGFHAVCLALLAVLRPHLEQ